MKPIIILCAMLLMAFNNYAQRNQNKTFVVDYDDYNQKTSQRFSNNQSISIYYTKRKLKTDTTYILELLSKAAKDAQSVKDEFKSATTRKKITLHYIKGEERALIKTEEFDESNTFVKEQGEVDILKMSQDSIVIIEKEKAGSPMSPTYLIIAQLNNIDDFDSLLLKNKLHPWEKTDRGAIFFIQPFIGAHLNSLIGLSPTIALFAGVPFHNNIGNSYMQAGLYLQSSFAVNQPNLRMITNYASSFFSVRTSNNKEGVAMAGLMMGLQHQSFKTADVNGKKQANLFYFGILLSPMNNINVQFDLGSDMRFKNKSPYNNLGVSLMFTF